MTIVEKTYKNCGYPLPLSKKKKEFPLNPPLDLVALKAFSYLDLASKYYQQLAADLK